MMDLSHEIDYLQWLFGELVSFDAISSKISALEIESDDYLSLIGRTNQAVYINLNMDYLSRIPIRQILIQTNTMTIVADLLNGKIERKKDGNDSENISFSDLNRNSTYYSMHEAILSDKSDNRLCSYTDGITIISAIEKIRKFRVESI
jgi:predicted dehydrogenase